ncbi:MAG: ferrous iron transport protein B [Verrucomicrobia bacterium]|nr:ferrous iron transport protein B [Verrucomicrobiota bacterium]
MQTERASACATCVTHRASSLKRLGLNVDQWDYVVALAGNPNVGKSTVFNMLTGLRQHTGNWPGKTVTRSEGGFLYDGKRYRLVDLPGTYSLLSASPDEQVARDFILFGRPDVTVIVVDATRLERNLNLTLQILEITDRAVVCLNLVDEAKRHGIVVDERQLARELGVPVVPASARFGRGIDQLLRTIAGVASGAIACKPVRLLSEPPALQRPLNDLVRDLQDVLPALPNPRWVALRLLAGDDSIAHALIQGELGGGGGSAETAAGAANPSNTSPNVDRAEANPDGRLGEIVRNSRSLRTEITGDIHEHVVAAIYAKAAEIVRRVIGSTNRPTRLTLDQRIDRIVTSRLWGFPIMVALFTLVFWITISGANIPSGWINSLLVGKVYPWLREAVVAIGFPAWVRGVVVDGMYLATAWVVSVMLPPMAIFFPLFTLLEDFGYLPRVAFNLDTLFRRAGAHGKQAMSMMMGFGCNAAGVVATRIIDSPRERLIAILTNNFALCNGRWPAQFLMASIFLGSLVSAPLAGFVSAAAVTGVAMLGVVMTFTVSWALSKSLLGGQVSTFSLELPPYRPPRILQTLYTSLIDRTLFVLWRAVVFALPAGAVIWLVANVTVSGQSLAAHFVNTLNPLGLLMGLNGVILLAYVIAIPANEIVIPTILMLTVLLTGSHEIGRGAGVLFEVEDQATVRALLMQAGWTTLTGLNLMLFSLLHNPCSTTIYTIYKETGSARWAAYSAIIPLAIGFAVTLMTAALWRWLS